MKRIAVIWSRFGPYHLARLRGAAEAGRPQGVELFGVEVAAVDRQYAWAKAGGADGFRRVTVFPDENYHDKSPRQIRAGIRQVLDRIDPAVVAINGWSVAEARSAMRWCLSRKRRSVVMSETKLDDHPRVAWREFVKRLAVRRFDAALVGGRAQAEYLTALGFPRERIQLGYDAVDNRFFSCGAARARVNRKDERAARGLPDRFFFACTRLLVRKNIDGLLRAYAAYRAQSTHPVWGLVIAGSGEEEEHLRATEKGLRLQGVVWPGFLQYSDLPVYFGLAGAFVHPAKAEAWGLVVNEAAASGAPLLISRTVGASHELVHEGENGFLFDPENEGELAGLLLKVAESTAEHREAMGLNAQRAAFAWGPERFGVGLMVAAGF